METLKFQKGNSKLHKGIFTFSLPSGHTCPFADICLVKSDKVTGKLTYGKNNKFGCFAASAEMQYKNVRNARWHNFDLLRKLDELKMTNLILKSIPNKAQIIRVHVAGDFFNQSYFNAWINVANKRRDVIFYAYTKSIQFWLNRKNEIPTNLKLNASIGGKNDSLIYSNGLKFAKVVYSVKQAEIENLPIDHDDSHAYLSDNSFALLIHGMQKSGSDASQAIKELKKQGVKFSYSNKK
jgi:hypothetical protein